MKIGMSYEVKKSSYFQFSLKTEKKHLTIAIKVATIIILEYTLFT